MKQRDEKKETRKLLAPVFLVFVRPFLGNGFEGIQLGWFLLDNGWLR